MKELPVGQVADYQIRLEEARKLFMKTGSPHRFRSLSSLAASRLRPIVAGSFS
jgi:hypothetical protein